MKTIEPLKYAVEWRYPPKLDFYKKMDEIGLLLLDVLPDWKRSGNRLTLLKKDPFTRSALEFNRSHIEFCHRAEITSHENLAVRVHNAFQELLPTGTLMRIGVRAWFSLECGNNFQTIVDRVQRRFYVTSDKVDEVLGGKVVDTIYSAHLELEKPWKLNAMIGPTVREEWLGIAAVDKAAMASANPVGFKEFTESIDEASLYADFDAFTENATSSEFESIIKTANQHIMKRAKALMAYYTKG